MRYVYQIWILRVKAVNHVGPITGAILLPTGILESWNSNGNEYPTKACLEVDSKKKRWQKKPKAMENYCRLDAE